MARFCASFAVLEHLNKIIPIQHDVLLKKVGSIINEILSVKTIQRFRFSPFFKKIFDMEICEILEELKELTDIGGSAYKASQMPAYRKYFNNPIFKALALKNIHKTTQTFKIARLMQLRGLNKEPKYSKNTINNKNRKQ